MTRRAGGVAELRPAFERQRRKLIGSSIILTLFLLTGATLEKLNLLGNELTLTRPSAIPALLALAHGYFVVRYLQHFNDLGDGTPRVVVSEWIRDRILAPISDRLKTQAFDEIIPGGAPPQISVYQRSTAALRLTRWHATVVLHADTFTPIETSAGREKKFERSVYRFDEVVNVPISLHLRAWAHLTIRTRFATEYALPLLLACLPVWIATYRWASQ